jgi:hypothetical protein
MAPSSFYRIKEKNTVFEDGDGTIKVPIIDASGKIIAGKGSENQKK